MIGTFTSAGDDEIAALLSDPSATGAFLDAREAHWDDRSIEIDKTWHGLHWLLTGSVWEGDPPLNFIVSGGSEIGDGENDGYGPTRAFASAELRAIHDALEPITSAELISRYDGAAMGDVYPEIWDRPDEQQSNREYLTEYFEVLKVFIARGVRQGQGMLVSIT